MTGSVDYKKIYKYMKKQQLQQTEKLKSRDSFVLSLLTLMLVMMIFVVVLLFFFCFTSISLHSWMIYKKNEKISLELWKNIWICFIFLKQNKVKKVATGQQQQQQQTIMAGWLADRANKTSRRNFKRVL